MRGNRFSGARMRVHVQAHGKPGSECRQNGQTRFDKSKEIKTIEASAQTNRKKDAETKGDESTRHLAMRW